MDDEARREDLGATDQVTCAIDFICLGRAAVDLYGLERGARLEDAQHFAKYLGGSSGNVATGKVVRLLERLGYSTGVSLPALDAAEAFARTLRSA